MQRFARSKSISLIINKADGAWESNPIANDCIVQSNVQTINPKFIYDHVNNHAHTCNDDSSGSSILHLPL